MIELNPLVKSHHSVNTASSQESNDPPILKCTHSVTDRLSYLPLHLWDSEITYTAAFQDTELGLVTEVSAPLGVQTTSEWKLLSPNERSPAGHNGSLEAVGYGVQDWILHETATVSCSIFLMPFVKIQIEQSHGEMLRRFRERLEGVTE